MTASLGACPGLVWGDDEPYQCGLNWPHDGEHVPHVGDYLPPPILHPLDDAGIGRPCPLCGSRVTWLESEAAMAYRHWEDGGWLPPENELVLTFHPCGHEMREITPPAASD